MIVQTVFALGAWRARHVPGVECWCRPRREQDGRVIREYHRRLDIGGCDRRQRAFVTGGQAPV